MNKYCLLLIGMAVLLAGCSLAPQTIQLNEQVTLERSGQAERGALIRVIDERETEANVLGTRGGSTPEKSPLYLNKELADVLSARLQNSLSQFGFGASEGSSLSPVKVELMVKDFYYECNKNLVSNDCSMEMRFLVTVMDGPKTFKKPYGINEQRSVAASPIAQYNQDWLNEMLDKVWIYMFNDHELLKAMGVK